MAVAELLETLAHRSLDHEESYATFGRLVRGELTELEIAALLAALKTRGETPNEIAGAARALREAAVPFPKPAYPVADTCGTGGDGAGTVNLSTAAAFVVAEAGLPVAKHGNRAASSRCGSADLLEALGVRLDPTPAVARQCLDQTGLCFLFAPAYHGGVRRASGVRAALKTRTLFNLLGPLANPARPEFQVMGVYDPALCRPMAETLRLLGCRGALVVNGAGLDEIALHGPTVATALRDDQMTDVVLGPEQAGLRPVPLGRLVGGSPSGNATWLSAIVAGHGSEDHNAAVAINAGAMLWVADRARSLREGTEQALAILREGRAAARLDQLVELSNHA
jgi:anthranilate phosphoribosyltransferase